MTQLSLCKLLGTPGSPKCNGDGLTNVLRLFWEVESIGIKDEPGNTELREEFFLTNVKFTSKHYKVSLLG